MTAPKLRPAEEIAREMVPEPRYEGADWRSCIRDEADYVPLEVQYDEPSAQQIVYDARALVARLIEQARADRRAAVRADAYAAAAALLQICDRLTEEGWMVFGEDDRKTIESARLSIDVESCDLAEPEPIAAQQPGETIAEQEARHRAALRRPRADGAAAERAAQNDQVDVQIRDDWKATAIDHYREGLHRILNGEPNPQAMAACYLGEDAPSRPRDVAGRIRALVQEYAGRMVDDENAALGSAYEDVISLLRECIAGVRAGVPGTAQACVDALRREFDLSSAGLGEPLWRAADELEAIVRECAKDQQ